MRELDLQKYVVTGQAMHRMQERENVEAELFEAVVGSLYVEGGLDLARSWYFKHFPLQVAKHRRGPSDDQVPA